MKVKTIIYAFILFCLFISTAFGQNLAQIKEKYGQPVEAYSVSERIWMTPEFTADGQVCRMRLYPKTISASTDYLSGGKLDYRELKDVINQISPAETRGEREDFFGLTLFFRQSSNTIYIYENICFNFDASRHFASGKQKKSMYSEIPKEPTKDEKKLNGELIIPRDAETVTITWMKRDCAKK